jgi:hypothetical protein
MREMDRIDDALVDLARGMRVDILNPFVPSWSSGFVIEDVVPYGVVVRREVDEHVLPRVFGPDEVRPAVRSRTSWF